MTATTRTPHRPSRARPGLVATIVAVLAILVAACSPTGSPSPAAPTDRPTAAPTFPPIETESPGPSSDPGSAAYPLRLFDDEGTLTYIPKEPRRIVSLTPAATEILFALGVGDRVVATTDADDYPPEAVALEHVASFTAVDVEKIVDLEPDLVIAGGNNFNPPEAINRLRTFNLPVLVIYAPSITRVFSDIEFIGRAVNRPALASTISRTLQSGFGGVASATGPLSRPRVFYELDATNGIFGPADKSFIEEMIRVAGGEPITTGSETSFQISLEKLVQADPEIIILGDALYGVTPEIVSARPGWGGMTAVRTGAIRPIDDIIVTRPGPRLLEGLRALARAIHPEVVLPGVPAVTPAPATPIPSASSVPVPAG